MDAVKWSVAGGAAGLMLLIAVGVGMSSGADESRDDDSNPPNSPLLGPPAASTSQFQTSQRQTFKESGDFVLWVLGHSKEQIRQTLGEPESALESDWWYEKLDLTDTLTREKYGGARIVFDPYTKLATDIRFIGVNAYR